MFRDSEPSEPSDPPVFTFKPTHNQTYSFTYMYSVAQSSELHQAMQELQIKNNGCIYVAYMTEGDKVKNHFGLVGASGSEEWLISWHLKWPASNCFKVWAAVFLCKVGDLHSAKTIMWYTILSANMRKVEIWHAVEWTSTNKGFTPWCETGRRKTL